MDWTRIASKKESVEKEYNCMKLCSQLAVPSANLDRIRPSIRPFHGVHFLPTEFYEYHKQTLELSVAICIA